MPDFKDIREQLRQARDQQEQTRLALFLKKEKLKKIEAEQVRLDRIFDQNNEQHLTRRRQLESIRAETENVDKQLEESFKVHRELEVAKFLEFSQFTDPTTQVAQLSDDYPFLLFPVRIETRFKTDSDGKPQLWVRVYPDDCLIDTFEPVLSEAEVKNAQSYWAEIWRAGRIEDQERGAWRTLVGSHGSGRAAWIIQHYEPLNIKEKPQKANKHDIILVIATDTPLVDQEKTAANEFWKAVWLADGDRVKEESALKALKTDVGEERVKVIIENYRPINLDEKPTPPLTKTDVTVKVETVVFPKPDKVETKQLSWTQAAKVNLLPDRFVVMGYVGDTMAFGPVIGNPIPSPLVVSPDPSAASENQMRQEGDEIIVGEDMKWMVDFERAIDVGMGFKIDLTPQQARDGFDRIIVLGVRLSADDEESKKLLETLIYSHQYGRSGFSILPQGTPTNNTEKTGSGFTHADDPDVSFDDFFKKGALFNETSDWLTRQDGQWLGDCLGIDNKFLEKVQHSGATDQCEAKAMNTALWPATMGYFLETMMAPIFNEDIVHQARWFFNNFVSGRGMIPAVGIGSQPYGILPTTVFSRMRWMYNEEFRTIQGLPHPEGYRTFLRKLYEILSLISRDWSNFANQVSYVSKPGDAHQILLDIIGLHAGSVEFHQRFSESLEHLYNLSNLMELGNIVAAEDFYVESGIQLLRHLGYEGEATPEVLTKFFLEGQNRLQGQNGPKDTPLIDDRPLSEMEKIRNYTPDKRNYIQWLIDAARTSLETIRLEKGFNDNTPPTALLYLLLRYAIELGYWDAGIRLYQEAGLLTGETLMAARREPNFVHVQEKAERSESKWYYLYRTEPQITQSVEVLVGEYVTAAMAQAPVRPATRYLNDQITALEKLKEVPTAALERVLAEHIDCCTYRLDAWKLGLIHYQLAAMRYQDGTTISKGLYLGAYGWLEDVRPENKILTPVDLEPALKDIFNKTGDAPLVKDSTNAGYIHAPSLNHAVTAAVLRNGYISNATPENPGTLAVNLSSERVRLALSILEGIRNGQSLAALLGYQFERGLHDRHNVAEVDQFIFKLRKAFPLSADRFSTTKTPEDVSIEAIEARNVINGLDLINHIKNTGNKTYPFGKDLPKASEEQARAINAEVDRIMNLHDAVADLAMAESVHQVAQGNYDRAAATLDAYSKANFPPEPEVIQTPRSGITLTHRVALHLETGLNPEASPHREIPMTPRAQAEPAINKWLLGILPVPENTGCKVIFFDSGTKAEVETFVTQIDLKLQPIDLLYMINPETQQAMTELDDRVVNFIVKTFSPRPDSPINIKYIGRIESKINFFELAPLIKSLRSLTLRSRPLRAGDVALQNEATSDIEKAVFLNKERIDLIINRLETPNTGLVPRLQTFQSNLGGLYTNLKTFDTLIAEYDTLPPDATDEKKFELLQKAERLVSTIPTIPLPPTPAEFKTIVLGKKVQYVNNMIINEVDQYINTLVDLLSAVGLYGTPQTGFGFAFDRKRGLYGAIFKKVDDLVKRWKDKLEQFDKLMAEYRALPPTTTDAEKFELLQKAERLVSTISTITLPATPAEFETTVLSKKGQFFDKMEQFKTLLQTSTTSIATLLADAKAQLPVSNFDLIGIDLSDEEKQIVLFVEDLFVRAKNLADDLEKRLKAANAQMDIFKGAAEATVQVQALLEAAKMLLGEDFRIVPEFSLTSEQGDEWQKAWNSKNKNGLLDYQTETVGSKFPVDDWLYGVARVREKMRHWENVTMLTRAFGKAEPELHPMQLPYKANECWLALSFPEHYKFEGDELRPGDHKIDGDRLLYTAHYMVPFRKTDSEANRQCGLLLDEWTEVIPAKNETTGITFHYDRPNSEPPQAMLLVTPPDFKGNWQWQDLVDALRETLDMAKQRAVEPQQIDATSYACFLPAILMAATLFPITIGMNLAVSNGMYNFLTRDGNE
jgi:hypothetical protein